MCLVTTRQHGTDGQRGGIQHGGHGAGRDTKHTPRGLNSVTTVAIYFGEDEELVSRLLKTDNLKLCKFLDKFLCAEVYLNTNDVAT